MKKQILLPLLVGGGFNQCLQHKSNSQCPNSRRNSKRISIC
ncbi:hypothetical protein [Campylobacter helveticus]|nr:hypothetical protein [Campylobacter helveticus]MCR2060902.1 hypothetical protein [Campylobacter helveticus]MCR2066344.1 hypothetical protein [Campylobacter helveticus]